MNPDFFGVLKNKLSNLLIFVKNHFTIDQIRKINFDRAAFISISALFIFSLFYFAFLRAPDDFPERKIITIEKNSSLAFVADQLYKKKVIKSPFWFKNFVILSGGDKIVAGDYYFAGKIGSFGIARRISKGVYGLDLIKIFIPEGYNIFDTAAVLKKGIPEFDDIAFLKQAKDKEGYLFPDTYLLLPNVSPKGVINYMSSNFNSKIEPLNADIKKFNKPVNQIITMASILEKEARTLETKKVIAGILWKRLSIGMPLQVDAAFDYIDGLNPATLTLDDLKVESPYNTYRNKGLPPTPIANPGLDSIIAAISPKKSNYLYYLSDRDGNMHYSVTFAEHVENKNKYLR